MSDLFSHQERVYDLIASDKNVLLQAPTGSGKTRAALYPFISMFDEPQRPFPHKCIYSVPMRVLAKQFTHEYKKTLEGYKRSFGVNISVKIQTGEQPEDPEFASNLIFATIDQTLSSFLLNPYGLPKRRANLNAAAVMASYLVFDEFHLFDPSAMLPTTLHMLQMLNGITPFTLMTATFSQDMLEGLAKLLNAEIVQLTPEKLDKLSTQNKTRRYHVADQPMTADTILDKHSTRSLVICNTIDRARRIYEDLYATTENTDTEVVLLHSRFLPEDRNKIEEEIRVRFGKDDTTGGSLIAVSTQAIEVGVDITSVCLHTELAPANTIVQRAGRCARYEDDTGDVYVYRHVYNGNDEIIDLCENTLPYKGQVAEFERTWREFSEHCGEEGDKLQYTDEQQIISAVHGERDKKLIEDLRSTSAGHRREMFRVMRDGERVSHLIRDAFQQRITISDEPDLLLDSPFDAPAFGVFPFTLESWVDRWLENPNPAIPWCVKYLHQPERGGDADIENLPRYEWIEIRTKETIRGAGLLVVHPLMASYDPKLGFIPEEATPPEKLQKLREWFKLPDKKERREGSRYTYRLETYEDHIAQVYRVAFEYGGMWEEMQGAAVRLEHKYGWENGSIRRAAQLAVLLHDVGKLSVKWQGWVREYQRRIGVWDEEKAQHAYAHTLLKTDEHREIEKHMPKRPWHAVESALASIPVLNDVLGDSPLARVVYSAIARHHSPRSAENQEFRIVSRAGTHVAAALEAAADKLPMTISPELRRHFSSLMLYGISEVIEGDADPQRDYVIDLNDEPRPDDINSYFAYWLIVRVLRRADQLGTERGGKGV